MANLYAVEIEDPASFEGVQRIIVDSAPAANAIAAARVEAMLRAIGFCGDRPLPECWTAYRDMLRAMVEEDGAPLPDVRIRPLPEVVVLLRADNIDKDIVALSSG
jgi:hypothetical protein